MKILYVTTKWLLPIEDGSRIASKAILEPLIKLNPDLSYLALAGEDEKIDEQEFRKYFAVKNIHVIKRAPHKVGLAKYFDFLFTFLLHPFYPISFNRYRLAKHVQELLKNHTFEIIILDGLHSAVPFINITHPPLILRQQNVEHNLWFNSAQLTNNPLKKLFFSYQAWLVKNLEQKIINEAEMTFAISDEDQAELSIITHKKIFNLPVGLNFDSPLQPHTSNKLQLLFLGKLDWEPNKLGLEWFLEEVWPNVSHERFHLTIAGSGDHDWLQDYLTPSITFLGRVPEVKTVYEKSHLVIIPIFLGSGTRIKVLEASRFQRTCISTKMGIQGSPLVEYQSAYFAAETAEEWIKELENISQEKIHYKAEKAFELCAEVLEEKSVAEKFYSELKNAIDH